MVEPAELETIEDGFSREHVVVLPITLVVTMIGVIAYVDVLPRPTERVGKEQTAPLSVQVS